MPGTVHSEQPPNLDVEPESAAGLNEVLGEFGVGRAAVDLRLAAAETPEVCSVEDEDLAHGDQCASAQAPAPRPISRYAAP